MSNVKTTWWSVNNPTPPENTPLQTIIMDSKGVRNEQTLMKRGNLWWFPDGSMYVYYTPTHWQYL